MFTPLPSLAGGLLIGLSAALLLVGHGRLAGISGILGDAIRPGIADRSWRLLFLAGLIGGGALLFALWPSAFPRAIDGSVPKMIVAGVLVGVGTRLGSGCTSGHGVCGIGRLSMRSIVATMVFMLAGAVTVFVTHHVGGR
jgi:uncharacterized membrane protein YedE/YeeE